MNFKRKTVRSTAAQLRVLVDHMSTNPLFACGQFTGPLGANKIEAEWSALATKLESYGPKKSVEQWKHTWRDIKKRARAEGSKVRQAINRTGNQVPIPEISEMTSKILNIIGHESATGIDYGEETGIGGDMDPFIPAPPEFQEEVVVLSDEVIVVGDEPALYDISLSPTANIIQAESQNQPSTSRGQPSTSRGQPSKSRGQPSRSRGQPSRSRGQPSSRIQPSARRGARENRPSQTSNAKVFIKTQEDTNKILKNIETELKKNNELRKVQLEVLTKIADKLDRYVTGLQRIEALNRIVWLRYLNQTPKLSYAWTTDCGNVYYEILACFGVHTQPGNKDQCPSLAVVHCGSLNDSC